MSSCSSGRSLLFTSALLTGRYCRSVMVLTADSLTHEVGTLVAARGEVALDDCRRCRGLLHFADIEGRFRPLNEPLRRELVYHEKQRARE